MTTHRPGVAHRSGARRRGPVLLAALAALVTGAAGCAAIPETSQVIPIGAPVSATADASAPGPIEDADPLTVVRDFISTADLPANGHAAARAYLTDEAARSWDDEAPVTVIDSGFGTGYSINTGAAADEYVQVRLRAQKVGTLGPDGAFSSNRDTITPTMDLVRVNGQWRISQLPAGLLITLIDFRSSYRSIGVSFLDQARATLVVDRRWMPTKPEANWYGRTIDMLLAGPSEAAVGLVNLLEGAVVHTNVVPGESGALTVDLTGLPDLSEEDRRRAGAQIVNSLREVWNERVRIVVDGATLLPNKNDWSVPDALPYQPPDTVKPDLPALAVAGGRLVRVEGDDRAVAGPAGDGSLVVRSAAQSLNGELLALVTEEAGLPRLYVGPPASPQPVTLQASRMTRPTWRAGPTAEVWTVLDNKVGVGVLRTQGGELRQYGIDLNELSVKGRITELRLSRDGVRAAAVVDGALYMAVVVGSGSDTRVVNPRLLVGPAAPQIADVDWKGPQRVVVAGTSRDTPYVYDVSIDGLEWNDYGNTNLAGPVTGIAAAASGRRVYVSDAAGLWYATSTNDVAWYSTIAGLVTDPLYPG
ncbi:MAG TPA: LpqB family beta-propeller domain-containing protein [Pseudonocardiaceae bacterium]